MTSPPNKWGKILKLRGNVHKVSNLLPVPDPVCSWSALLTTSSWLRRDRVRERGETTLQTSFLNTSVGRVCGFQQRDLEIQYFETTPRDLYLDIVCIYVYTYQWIKAPKMESWYWRIDWCNLDIWNAKYICLYLHNHKYTVHPTNIDPQNRPCIWCL